MALIKEKETREKRRKYFFIQITNLKGNKYLIQIIFYNSIFLYVQIVTMHIYSLRKLNCFFHVYLKNSLIYIVLIG